MLHQIPESICGAVLFFKGGAKKPDPPPPPPPAPAPPVPELAAQELQNQDYAKRRKAAKGFESTILTSGLGVTTPEPPKTFLKTLLGQ